MLKMAKSKKGIKSSDSDHAYLLDFRVCHQNKTKLLLGIFMFCWLLFVFLVFCGVTFCTLSHNKTSINQKQQQKHENTQESYFGDKLSNLKDEHNPSHLILPPF